MANAFGNEEIAYKFETVLLSHRTVSGKVDETSIVRAFRMILEMQCKPNCKYYSNKTINYWY